MVRRTAAPVTEIDSDPEERNERPLKKRIMKASAKKNGKSLRKKISPSKTPASKRRRHQQQQQQQYIDESDKDDEEEENGEEEEEEEEEMEPKERNGGRRQSIGASPDSARDDDDDDVSHSEEDAESEGYSPRTSNKKKKSISSAKKKKTNKITPRKRKLTTTSTDDEKEESDSEDDDDDIISSRKPRVKKISLKRQGQATNLPPVSDMVCDSIRALRDNPRKGSTISSIKETILLNFSVDMKKYDGKIKKYILNAIATGELKQSRGVGLRGRVTLPSMKAHRRKKNKASLSKKFDVDEVEYTPVKTQRDEERVKDHEELERRRLERAIRLEKELAEKESKPKKAPPPKREEWDVRAIQGYKVVNGVDYYLVKYDGPWKPQWEPEENVEGCKDMIKTFLKEEELRKEALAQKRKEAEENGVYEVARILDVQFHRNNKREFLIRWKDWGHEGDTWEEEENLDCDDLIADFMRKVDEAKNASAKNLRMAPKRVDRLAFSQSKRSKRNGAFRITYTDME